ncbi:ATP-binding protein [Lentzea sp. PSKA42]|uniref:ATP-binding protein n=1 Tax=Lentzea indica TaxID=2604800 RepID=A0ABX1FCH0_9PSEU|nr:ATP-binding protein [Lentzea indica]NKE56618.1 ATP-binding protein [Lentzea indica]
MVAPLRPGLVGTVVREAGGLLVGRDREIAVLTDALGGGARSCVVHGATGMGKSALLSVASSIAVRSGLRPARGLRALSGVDRHTVLVVDDAEQLSAEETERLSRFRGAVVVGRRLRPGHVRGGRRRAGPGAADRGRVGGRDDPAPGRRRGLA